MSVVHIHCQAAVTNTWMLCFLENKLSEWEDSVPVVDLEQLAVFFFERRCRVPTLSISTL